MRRGIELLDSPIDGPEALALVQEVADSFLLLCRQLPGSGEHRAQGSVVHRRAILEHAERLAIRLHIAQLSEMQRHLPPESPSQRNARLLQGKIRIEGSRRQETQLLMDGRNQARIRMIEGSRGQLEIAVTVVIIGQGAEVEPAENAIGGRVGAYQRPGLFSGSPEQRRGLRQSIVAELVCAQQAERSEERRVGKE